MTFFSSAGSIGLAGAFALDYVYWIIKMRDYKSGSINRHYYTVIELTIKRPRIS